jgi:hypothetical protein
MWLVIWRNMLGQINTMELRTEREAKQVAQAIVNAGMPVIFPMIDF